MPKKIVILMDGTSNQISADRTNILRLYGTLKKNTEQLVFYDPGVGTMAAGTGGLGQLAKVFEVIGMATGRGLHENVMEAYRFLVDNFEYQAETDLDPGWQDEIYIIGFSRGAYSARILAGFLRAFGIIEKRNLNLLGYIYRAYRRVGGNAAQLSDNNKRSGPLRHHRNAVQPFAPSIKFLGLFDTVSSVFEIERYLPKLKAHAFVNNNNRVEHIRHAVAIHEKRVMFRPCFWPEGQKYIPRISKPEHTILQDQREVWFTGVHTDVGGGEPKVESGLAKIPLAWLVDQAKHKDIGLLFETKLVNLLVLGKKVKGFDKTYTAPDPLADKHKMGFAWKILEYLPAHKPKASKRRLFFGWTIPLFEWRAIPEGARIHSSVFERAAKKDDLPPNIPADHRVEP